MRDLAVGLTLMLALSVTTPARVAAEVDAGEEPVSLRFDFGQMRCPKSGHCATRAEEVAAEAQEEPLPPPDPHEEGATKESLAREEQRRRDKVRPCLCQDQFDALNYTSQRHFLVLETDHQWTEVHEKSNAMAGYINDLNTDWLKKGVNYTIDREMGRIRTAYAAHMPKWIMVNEISFSQWPLQSDRGDKYRQYVVNFAAQVKIHDNPEHMDRQPIVFTPFAGAKDVEHKDKWSELARVAYVAPEMYISGQRIAKVLTESGHDRAVQFCENQYNEWVQRYHDVGVEWDRLILVEHFGNTTQDRGWGESGVSIKLWKEIVKIKCEAMAKIKVKGYCSYAWAFNGMFVSDADRVECMRIYGAQKLP